MAGLTTATDPTRLAPGDAYLQRRPASASPSRSDAYSRAPRDQLRKRSRSRRRQTTWKKLLWVKQSYPDNYTDEATFLDALQRNPRLVPYEFWPLVADSTVIVQQLCTVIVFASCFAGIFQERVSPVVVVRWSTTATVLGWLLWHVSIGKAQASNAAQGDSKDDGALRQQTDIPPNSDESSYERDDWPASTRNQQRLATAKSAILIYFTLLGLSPILKSLTESTSSDSIWAISFWLLCINVVFFDYSGTSSGDVGAPSTRTTPPIGGTTSLPASLSTNAALMASTVLASRLPSTTHVFSLTLFSIEVFGLFPIFRLFLRRASRRGHFALTALLVLGAGGGAVVSFSRRSWWPAGVLGAILGCMLAGLSMGLCSWWLIGLQQYKNEIRGPWDPARPIIRRFD